MKTISFSMHDVAAGEKSRPVAWENKKRKKEYPSQKVMKSVSRKFKYLRNILGVQGKYPELQHRDFAVNPHLQRRGYLGKKNAKVETFFARTISWISKVFCPSWKKAHVGNVYGGAAREVQSFAKWGEGRDC